MGKVKGSKQHQMVVVPHRPWMRVWIFCFGLATVAALCGLTYLHGLDEGLAAKRGLLVERDALLISLARTEKVLAQTRQELADVKLGGEVDVLANEEVRQSVEALQSQIAELNEEIRFYKGVMVPNADSTGLRIEQFAISATEVPDRFHYSMHLTQIVEKHEYVIGTVKIAVVGMLDGNKKNYQLSEVSESKLSQIKFRFRYFQKIAGDVILPDGFIPEQMIVVVLPSDQKVRGLDKTFEWRL